MTMIEVLVAGFIATLAIGALWMSIVMASETTAAAAQHTAAMQLCMELAERIRATPFADVHQADFPLENSLTLTLPESISGRQARCQRQVVITDESTTNLPAKRIQIAVRWQARGRNQQQTYETIIYPVQ